MSGPGNFLLPPTERWEKEKLTFSCCLSPSATVWGQSGLKRRLKIQNTAWILHLPRKTGEKDSRQWNMCFLVGTIQPHSSAFTSDENFQCKLCWNCPWKQLTVCYVCKCWYNKKIKSTENPSQHNQKMPFIGCIRHKALYVASWKGFPFFFSRKFMNNHSCPTDNTLQLRFDYYWLRSPAPSILKCLPA